jgi:hypothetical protein
LARQESSALRAVKGELHRHQFLKLVFARRFVKGDVKTVALIRRAQRANFRRRSEKMAAQRVCIFPSQFKYGTIVPDGDGVPRNCLAADDSYCDCEIAGRGGGMSCPPMPASRIERSTWRLLSARFSPFPVLLMRSDALRGGSSASIGLYR